MNKKGMETSQVGALVVVAVAIIVGLVLLQQSAQNIGSMTNTVTLANSSFTSAAVGNSVYLTSYKSIADPVIVNATGTVVPAANYTITNNVVYNGQEAIQITTGAVNAYAGQVWNISGTAQPLTYDPNGGNRSIAGLVIVFFALAIGVIALVIVLQNKDLVNFGY